MNLLLLPGADGTGILFAPFLECLMRDGFNSTENIETTVINLNKDSHDNLLNQSLTIQAKHIEQSYGLIETANEPWVIIAESYSGLLAYELLKRDKLHVSHVIFIASFLKRPTALASIAPKLSPKWLKRAIAITPEFVWGRLVFGKWQTPYLHQLFKQSLKQTPNDLLQQRLDIIAQAKQPTDVIDVPCLYLQASHDNLVASNSLDDFKKVFSTFASERVEGTHFLLQTNPQAVWNSIRRFCLQ